MRVGCAVLRHLKAHPEIYPYLAEQSERLATEVNTFLRQERLPAQLLHAQSIFHLIFEPGERARDSGPHPMLGENALAPLFYAHLHKNGVIIPGLHVFFLSAAHTPEDVSTIITAFKQSLLELREQGAL
jgi:glutamate-1-semialdehyde aminotransferase